MRTKFDRELGRLEKKMSVTEKSLNNIRREQKRISNSFNWRRIPQAFRGKDAAQHAIGAAIILIPLFITSQETWVFAMNMEWWQLAAHIFITFAASVLILYFAKFSEIKRERFLGIPIRIYSLLAFCVLITGFFVIVYGYPPFVDVDLVNGEQAKIFIWFLGFSFVGAASADVIK